MRSWVEKSVLLCGPAVLGWMCMAHIHIWQQVNITQRVSSHLWLSRLQQQSFMFEFQKGLTVTCALSLKHITLVIFCQKFTVKIRVRNSAQTMLFWNCLLLLLSQPSWACWYLMWGVFVISCSHEINALLKELAFSKHVLFSGQRRWKQNL